MFRDWIIRLCTSLVATGKFAEMQHCKICLTVKWKKKNADDAYSYNSRSSLLFVDPILKALLLMTPLVISVTLCKVVYLRATAICIERCLMLIICTRMTANTRKNIMLSYM